jgi:hypothetical protein
MSKVPRIPKHIIAAINSPPLLKKCRICGALLEWNPYKSEWADRISGGRHYCPPEAIRALVPDVHECICGHVVLVYMDGTRTNQNLTPHLCNRKPPRRKQRKKTRPGKGAVAI